MWNGAASGIVSDEPRISESESWIVSPGEAKKGCSDDSGNDVMR